MSTDDVICVAAYFTPRVGTAWIDDAFTMAESFAESLKIRLTHVDVEDRSLAYGPKNIERARQWLTQGRSDIVSCVSTRPGNFPGKYLQAPFSILVDNKSVFSQRDRVGVAYVHSIASHFLDEGIDSAGFATTFMRFMCDRFDARYGVVHRMSQLYVPVTYFVGGPTSQHVSGADKIAQKKWYWRGGGARFHEIVLGAYWGNLLSSSHWRNDPSVGGALRRDLVRLCGSNIQGFDDGRILFWAPSDILGSDDEMTLFREELERVFDKHGIQMIGKMDAYPN